MDGDGDGEKPVATNRPRYRAGNKETAVKAYTINQESRYLIVKNVPALGNVEDLIKLFALYGTIEEYRLLDEEDTAEFTDVYWIRFQDIHSARIAKRKCDDYNFIGNLLDVAYAPQFESVADMKAKLDERRRIVSRRIAQNYSEKANDPKKGGGRRNEPPAERQQTLEPHQLPFEAPPDLPPTQLELLPTPKYRNDNPHLYVQNSNIRGQHVPPVTGQPPPPPPRHTQGREQQSEDREIRQPGSRTAGGGLVETYVPDSSVNATVLSIRNKLTKLADGPTPGQAAGAAAGGAGAGRLYPSQMQEQGSYYTPAQSAAQTKRKRI